MGSTAAGTGRARQPCLCSLSNAAAVHKCYPEQHARCASTKRVRKAAVETSGVESKGEAGEAGKDEESEEVQFAPLPGVCSGS